MEYKIYCGGSFLKSDNKLEIINPFSSKLFAFTWLGNADILEKAIRAAQQIETKLKTYPVYKKYVALMKWIKHF
ncbi:MAG: hypothetical protein K8S16_16965 [Bacteroidales bacterium]|nr:hypothetical protein [Bacteroidales bacterium]